MRVDRSSALDQWSLSEGEALNREFVGGRAVLAEVRARVCARVRVRGCVLTPRLALPAGGSGGGVVHRGGREARTGSQGGGGGCSGVRGASRVRARTPTPAAADSWQPDPTVRAVLFDVGGVLVDSPFTAIAAYERELRLPEGVINRVIAAGGDGGAFARLERGEVTVPEFAAPFKGECR